MENKKRRGPLPLDGLIKSFLRENNLTTSPGYTTVFRAWNDTASPTMRNHTEPVLFRGGKLTVEVDSAPLLQELRNFTGEAQRRKVNAQLGKETIRRIAFKKRG